MGRATTKDDLILAANGNFEKLNELICSLKKQLETPFDFSCDEKKTEAHWGREKNLRDVYIHLYEWHRLLLNWVKSNQNGDSKPFIPLPYNWKTYLDMNVEFWRKHRNTPLEKSKEMFYQSHKDVIELAQSFSNEELFSKNVFSWVGGSSLGAYFVSVTASHYDWAVKKLKEHKKNCQNKSV